MRGLLLVVLLGAAGVLGAQSPPLASHARAQEPHYTLDWGLSSINTDELWEEYTAQPRANDTLPIIEGCHLYGADEPIDMVGKTMLTWADERTIYAFQGIMYGEAMTGERRFKKTIKKEVYWDNDTTTLYFTHLGEKCPQHSMIGGVASGREDCLSLNVYTPYLPHELPNDEPLPVMFFIHGGAFISGDASLYLPTKLLNHNVILVVIHYRLGNFGFFSLDNDDAPGNAGLWDQITALEWVQDNIECFGGDPTKVTIFGESAGSASVNYLMLLPAAEGLFSGVIGESGSALEHWSHDPDPIGSSIAIGEYMDCPTDDLTKLYECMRDMDADKMAMNMSSFVGHDRKNGQMGFRGAAPVTQGPDVSERLVEFLPLDYLTSGNFSDVPLMIGTNKHEGSFVLTIMYTEFLKPNNKLNDSVYLRDDMMIDLLNCFGVHDYTNAISEAIMDSFVQELDRGNFDECAPGYVDAAGVLFLKAGGWETAKLHAKHGTANTFHYSFDFESDDTMYRWLFMGLTGVPFRPGVTHADELMYLFSFPAVLEGQQRTVSRRMTKMWTNFAKYGHPTPQEDTSWQDLDIPEWKPLTTAKHNFMLIQDEFSVEEEFPQRWHIALEEDGGLPWKPTLAEYSDLEDERDAYQISMIVFVVAFAIAALGAVFLMFKKKKKKSSSKTISDDK